MQTSTITMTLKATSDFILNQLIIFIKTSHVMLIFDYWKHHEVYFKTFLVFEISEEYSAPSLSLLEKSTRSYT